MKRVSWGEGGSKGRWGVEGNFFFLKKRVLYWRSGVVVRSFVLSHWWWWWSEESYCDKSDIYTAIGTTSSD